MKRRSFRVWLGLALLLSAVALPVCADTNSDVRALFFQASGVAAANGFNQGERVSLVAKVVQVLHSVERGDSESAANQLGAFINEVNALEQSGRLPSADAQALTGAANAILGEL
jgi:hypothetical protein